jgi:NADH:ubiquinone oxidoreductase subunit 6 (subunit J)
MSDKTKQYKWLPWAVAAGGAIVLIFLGIYVVSNWMSPSQLITPWESARAVDSIRAINEFSSGVTDTGTYWDKRIPALISLIVLFIIGPSLWVFSELRNQSKEDSENELKKGSVWYIGVMIVIAGLLYAVPVTIIKGVVFQNTWESAAKNENADELRRQLSTLAFDAYEKYYLPHDLGGGAKSFQSIPGDDGNLRNIRLADLENYNSETKNYYMLAPLESDSVIKIYGVGNKQGDDTNFENADGQQGKIQISVEIAPPADFKFMNSNY